MFDEYDLFILCKALPDESVPVGTQGVVLMVHDGTPRSYEVEFPDGGGGNLGDSCTYTITEKFMAPITYQ